MGIMKAITVRDQLKRKLIEKSYKKNQCLKALKLNSRLNFTNWSRIKLGTTPYFKVRNRCIITGRGKAVNRNFKLSRLEFRRWVNFSKLPGLQKSSW